MNHQALIRLKIFDQLRKHSGFLNRALHPDFVRTLGNKLRSVSILSPAIRKALARNAQKPRGERKAAPFELRKIAQSLVKNFGGHVFGVLTSWNPAGDVGVNAVKVLLVKLGEKRGVLLRRRNSFVLVHFAVQDFQSSSPASLLLS